MLDAWCETRIRVTKTTFSWTIDNLDYAENNPELQQFYPIISSEFVDNSDKNIKWFMKYYHGQCARLHLEVKNATQEIRFRYNIIIRNQHGRQIQFCKCTLLNKC